MPTKRQLSQLRESDFEFFKGQDPREYVPPPGPLPEFTGEVIGTIRYNSETGGFRIEPFTEEQKKADKKSDTSE